nr:hemagglutinin repeat-containing protein [uncultured Leptotrichia sp.]
MKNKILKKSVAFLLLVSMNMNIFAANLVLDPNSQHNTKLDTSANGTPIINISTPNNRGVSINEFLEYNVGHEGQVLNNADNLGRSHLAGLINANPNLGPNQAANLILLQVNGANRSQIEGYIEALSRDKVNVILSNENGIYLNGAGTINIRNFIPTTGRVKLKDGDVVGIDVEKGRVVIGANGFDATNTDYVNVIAKALEMQGNLVGNKVDVTLGENFVDNSGAVTSKGGINSVAIDASNLGSMYAGQVRIISTDKGAGVNSRALIYSKDEKLEITADGKINVAKIKGNGIEIKGSDYSQSEIASSDKDINITANTVKLAGQTQANGNISLNADVENDSEIFANGNLKTKDLTNSGKIQVSKTTQISGKLNNSGSVASVNKVTVTKDVKNTGEISTNDDFTAKNIVSSGKVSGKNIQVDNVSNNGKIIAASNFKAKKVKNTKEIAAVGKISTDDLETSGDVRSNGKITVNGNLENSGNVETGSDIAVSKDIKNSGKVLANGNLSGKNAENSGEVQAENISTDNVKNSGKINTKDFKSKNVTNTGKVLASGKISADDVDNGGKILTNGRLTAKNVKNSGKIASGDKISSRRLENSGTVATNSDISATDSLVNHNGGNIEGKNVEVKGFELRNAGKISAGNVKAKVNESTNSGQIHSSRDVDLDTQKLTNTGEILAVNDVNSANADVINNGKIASNNKILLDNSKITNTGEILSGDISMQNAQKFDNTGTIKANNTVLTTTQDINLDGNLHGQQRLIISGRNITNNGNTTGTGLIQITSNDFTNNRDISSDTVIINGQGNIVNNAMITGDNGKISGNDITNNDLIAFEKYLEINAQNKVQNNKDKTIYGGQTLIIKGNDILNDEGEILGGNMDLNAGKIVNNVGTIQATGDILITSSDFQNVGRVSNLDKYEKYYETWDGIKLSENEVNNEWIGEIGNSWTKRSTGSRGKKARKEQKGHFENIIKTNNTSRIKSLLLDKYGETYWRNRLGGGYPLKQTDSTDDPERALKGILKSNATTEYGKVLASGNITINSGNVKNKDSIISGGGVVNINSPSLENSVTTGNAVNVKYGIERMDIDISRPKKRRVRMAASLTRFLENGAIAYEAGQPSIIEGSVVNINAPVITSPITEANGKINNGSVTYGVAGSLFTNTIGKGISSTNGAVNVNLTNQNIQIANNMSSVQAILNTGTISVNPLLTSAMFTQNMNPSSKYLLETRSKYVDLNKYYGSDYFLSRLGYTPSWNRVRRLGDAYYENQLITRALTEQLGTAFINGKSNEDLIKSLMDNAGMESSRLGLQVGKELTPEQISGLSKDLIWYVTQNVNGVEVLVPKIYLSKDTLATITADGRNKIGGVNGTYIKTDNFVNNGMKIGNGGVTYVQANTIKNETATNLLSEITGDKTFIQSVGNIENIGGKISGNEAVVLISDNGKVINDTTKRSVGYYNSEFDRTKHEEVKSLGTISSNGTVFVKANSYESTGGMLSTDHLALDVNKINLNALSLSGEDKFGSGGSNFSRYAETTHLGAGVSANSASGTVGDMNLKGSSFIAKDTTGLTVTGNVNAESVINSYENESKSTSKGFMSSKSSYKNSHAEENSASNLMLGENAVILGDVNSIGSNVVLGDNTYIGGKLTTDAQQLHNSYFEENKKKGFSGGISHGTASLSYGKSQNSYDEKSTINAGSNLQIGDGSVLNKGAEITATNFEYGNIKINNGDVKYGARIDTRDVHTESKSSSFGISVGINSPILDRAKQAGNAVKQVKDGDTAGGAMTAINAVTGTIKGLADNQGTRQTNYDVNGNVGKQGVKNASANNNFYANIGVNAGISKSKSSSDSHTESAVITTMKPTDGNSSITYNNVKNIEYQGTQAQGGTFVYNNVENIRKEAVELHNSSNSSSSSKGISASATVGYGHKMQTTGNGGSISASKSNQNTEETMYQNGNFANVNEVHNNTGSMIISGFNQDGGKLIGNIGKVEVTSKQNTSTTTGSSKGMSVGVSSQGIPTSVNVNASKTNGNRNFVDNQSSFTVGEGSNLQVGTLENTGAIIGKQSENATFKIDNYIGKNLQNDDEMKTTGGAIGVSTGKPKVTSLEFSQDSRDKEGVTRNTVVGNVEIGQASGDEINRDLSKANEVTKDSRSSTNVSVESQTIEYATDSGKLKEDLGKAKDEIEAIGAVTKATIATIGSKEQNSFLDFLKTERLQETIRNIGYIDTKNKTKDEIVKEMKDKYGEIFKQNGKELEVNFYVNSEVSSDDPNAKDKTEAIGFTAEDGSIWLNADNISSIENFDLNSVFAHEGTHKKTGENTELLALFGQSRAENFIENAIDKGYLSRIGGGLNWENGNLTEERIQTLNEYTNEDIQYLLDGVSRGLFGDKATNKIQNGARWLGKTFGGKRGEAFVNKVINHDRKFYNNEGKTAGNVVHNVVKKSTGVDTRKLGDQAVNLVENIQNKKPAPKKRLPKKAPPKKRTTKKNNTDSETLYKNKNPKNLTELKTYYDGTGKLPKNTIIILQDENGKQRVYNSFDEFKNGTPEERKLEQIYANKINENGRKLELAKKNKNSDEIKRLEKESLQLHREQESIYRSRLSRMGDITLKGDLVSIASSYKDGKLVIKSEKYYHQLNSEEIALGLELLDHSSKVEQFYKPEVVNVGQRESHVGIKQDNINNPKITGEITNKKIDIKPVRQEKEDFQKRYERIKNNYYEQISNNYKNLTEHEKEVFQNYERTGWRGQYSGGPSNAGKIFDNDGRDGGEILPKKLGLEYREYDINIKVGPTRDDYRFVRGSDGSVYYTNNHYRTFRRVK